MDGRRRVSRVGQTAALLLVAGLAHAQSPGVSLGWQDCRGGGGAGGANQDFACVVPANDLPLFPTLTLTTPVDSVIAVELVLDVVVAGTALPAWWGLGPDGCRPSGWGASASPPASCPDAWGGRGVASAQSWLPGVPGGVASHGRMLVTAAVLPADAVTLASGVPHALCRVALRAVGSTTCEGCATPACLVLNSVLLRRLPGAVPETLLFSQPEAVGLERVTWQRGAGADCQSVPVRRSAWGAVKALYR